MTSGATTTTSYLGSLEEVRVSGATTTTAASYGSLALSVNGALSYTLGDNLGSVSESLNSSGVVTATQLDSPYGEMRYHSGALPTSAATRSVGWTTTAPSSGPMWDLALDGWT